MREYRLALLCALIATVGASAPVAQQLYVEGDGYQSIHKLSDIATIRFTTTTIVVKNTNGNLDSRPIAGLRAMHFAERVAPITKPPVVLASERMRLSYTADAATLQIHLAAPAAMGGSVRILSIDGRVVYTGAIASAAELLQISIASLPKGFYLCRVAAGNRVESAPFFKQ